MHTVHSWVQSKLARPFLRLRVETQATVEWDHFGPRGNYAKVTLVACPAQEFSLVSAPDAWKSELDRAYYEPYVIDGVLSELIGGPQEPVLGIRIVISAAVVHEVESNGKSFFQAAKLATQKLLAGQGGRERENCTDDA